MSVFKHHRNNKYRYNIYESYAQTIEPTNFYVLLRNALFFIALTLSLSVTSLISFDSYNNKKAEASHLQLINQIQQNQVKNKITMLELTEVISNSIIQKIETDDAFESINQDQLNRIVKHVMEKVSNSPEQIIYTRK